MPITSDISHPCALKAGEITGLGNDIFFLTYQEVWDLLRGISTYGLEYIPVRKSAYERQRAMQPYPPVIRGHFDPVKWLANPNKQTGYFDSHEFEVEKNVEQNSVLKWECPTACRSRRLPVSLISLPAQGTLIRIKRRYKRCRHFLLTAAPPRFCTFSQVVWQFSHVLAAKILVK